MTPAISKYLVTVEHPRTNGVQEQAILIEADSIEDALAAFSTSWWNVNEYGKVTITHIRGEFR